MLRYVGCCWRKFDQFQTWANNTQHVATHRNTVGKRTQLVAPNNVAICCVDMLRSFGQGLTKKPFKFPWKFCFYRHAWINQWFHNKTCLLWWPVSLSIRLQTTLNHIRFVLYHDIKDNERNLCFKICWQLKTPTPTWKCTRCIMQMTTTTRQLSCQKLLQTRSTCRSNKKQ